MAAQEHVTLQGVSDNKHTKNHYSQIKDLAIQFRSWSHGQTWHTSIACQYALKSNVAKADNKEVKKQSLFPIWLEVWMVIIYSKVILRACLFKGEC